MSGSNRLNSSQVEAISDQSQKMNQRAPRQRPTSSPSPQSARKVFNCIVDDTALVAGVKRSTRNGLRQWTKNGQIRLFVPLHALEQLNLQKNGTARHAEDVRETLGWLDQATTRFPNSVTLQGGDETFQQWSEVEKFVVPRSLFSENDHDEDSESFDQRTSGDIFAPDSPAALATQTIQQRADAQLVGALPSPPTSPSEDADEPATRRSLPGTADGQDGVPVWLQPLFNYILWRIHQEIDPVAALESFIFLCNDPAKANLAKGFEVRCKRLEQLRDAVGREDREFKNRQVMQHRSTQSVSSVPDKTSISQPQSPPTAPAAMLKTTQATNIIDPDAFERSGGNNINPINTARPIRGSNNVQRGRGGLKGRGRANGLSSPILARASLLTGNGRRRGEGLTENPADVGPEIDPNSFERPRGGHLGRGGRRLWTPG